MSIKRDELALPGSCLNSAFDDEPLFVLRANDELAPEIVRAWASDYFVLKNTNGAAFTPRQQAKYDDALRLADAMDRWLDAKERAR